VRLSQTQENFDFVALYDQWRNGHLHLRCQSIMSSLVVHSNGDVPLCQNLDVMLGNIHHQSLDEIFNGSQSCQTQCRYSKNCNDCWINFHRKYDIILLRNLERLLPKRLIEKFYGPYQWTDNPRTTYHQYIKTL
jgi:MoaA/NifB/PqqE/SkfB family radical SAM enzyme